MKLSQILLASLLTVTAVSSFAAAQSDSNTQESAQPVMATNDESTDAPSMTSMATTMQGDEEAAATQPTAEFGSDAPQAK